MEERGWVMETCASKVVVRHYVREKVLWGKWIPGRHELIGCTRESGHQGVHYNDDGGFTQWREAEAFEATR